MRTLALGILAAASLGGCAVVPAADYGYYPAPVYAAPVYAAPAVVVRPSYRSYYGPRYYGGYRRWR